LRASPHRRARVAFPDHKWITNGRALIDRSVIWILDAPAKFDHRNSVAEVMREVATAVLGLQQLPVGRLRFRRTSKYPYRRP